MKMKYNRREQELLQMINTIIRTRSEALCRREEDHLMIKDLFPSELEESAFTGQLEEVSWYEVALEKEEKRVGKMLYSLFKEKFGEDYKWVLAFACYSGKNKLPNKVLGVSYFKDL